jgi:hypothetical protein
MQHILKVYPGYVARPNATYINIQPTYTVWWAGGVVLTTSNETQAHRKAKEVNGMVRISYRDGVTRINPYYLTG